MKLEIAGVLGLHSEVASNTDCSEPEVVLSKRLLSVLESGKRRLPPRVVRRRLPSSSGASRTDPDRRPRRIKRRPN